MEERGDEVATYIMYVWDDYECRIYVYTYVHLSILASALKC